MAVNLRNISSLAVAGMAAAVLWTSPTPASAQMAPAADSPRSVEILARYNEAMQAAITCEGAKFTIDQETKVAEMAARASGQEYSTGKMLQTVSDTRPIVRMVQASMTCRDPMIMDRLAFFNSTIKPGL